MRRFPGDGVSDAKVGRRRGPLATAGPLAAIAFALFALGFARSASAELLLLELPGQVRWHELSPKQKERALKNYREYKNLSPEDRGRVDNGYKRWKGLSDDDKRRVRDRYKKNRRDDD